MADPLPIVLVPGLFATPRLYLPQLPALWRFGPVTIADHRRDDSMAGIARRILTEAPRRFALVGLSMGGYISFELMRQAPERIAKLALLDTAARPDTPEQTAVRRAAVELAQSGRYREIADQMFPRLVHPSRRSDATLQQAVRAMAEETGAEAFIRQQTAIMHRPDSRPGLQAIRCPTLVLAGDHDELTPPDRAREMAAGISGSRLVVVPECGHISTLERPEETRRALVEWLEIN